MNSRTTHLEDDELLRLLDGELDSGAASECRSHLEMCWTCRTRIEELESAIGDYVRYREAVRPLHPPPPGPWKDLEVAMQQVDRSLTAPQFAAPGSRHFLAFRTARWLAAAAAIAIAVLVIRRFEGVPAVSAAALLRKAAAVEQTAAPHKRIRIKTRSRSFTRLAALPAAAANADGDLERMFERAHFSWRDPLSARSYAAWHDQLSQKQDRVNAAEADAYIIQTATTAGELRQATLTLRKTDLRPTREMLEFVSDTVEITDVPEAENATVEPRAAPKNEPLAPTAAEPAGSRGHRKLQVFSALHVIGADLGEPVELRQKGSSLVVTGTGLTAAQQQQLRASLQSIPGVEVRFENATPADPDTGTPGGRASSATAPLQVRLQALLGNQEPVEDFIDRALDVSDAVMARAHALRALARAFSPDMEASLDAADRATLDRLTKEHIAVLAARLNDLREHLTPILRAQPRAATAIQGNSWQEAVEQMFADALNLDQLLNRALAGPDAEAADNDFKRIGAALARLEGEVATFQ